MFATAAQERRLPPVPAAVRQRVARLHQSGRRRSSAPASIAAICQRFGCEANAKGSPHMTVIPIAMRNPNFELRTHAWVTKVLKDSDGKRVTGVTYTNVLNGEEFEQPAGMVLLCAYAINNVHLMLLSGIGQPYDPAAQTGVIGKNYCYQTGVGATLFFEGRNFNPFMGAGGSNCDDRRFQHQLELRPRPARFRRRLQRRRRLQHGAADRLPAGAARHAAMGQGMEGGDRQVVPDRDEHQRERQRDGQPLQLLRSRSDLPQRVRPAADAHDLRLQGERAQAGPARRRDGQRDRQVDESDRVSTTASRAPDAGRSCPTRARTTPAARSWAPIRATARSTSICRAGTATTCSWWAPTCSPHNASYNPTGPVGALAYWTADAIKNRYIKNPGPLVPA